MCILPEIAPRKVCILHPLWRRYNATKVCILPEITSRKVTKCASSALYGADITSRKCVFCRYYVTESVHPPPSMAPTLRHESVAGPAYITSREVCILRPLWRRHYVTKVCILPILRRGKCILRPLWRRHHVTKVLQALRTFPHNVPAFFVFV